MNALFSSGQAADIVLGELALESVWLARRGWGGRRIALALGPAVCIMLAVRAALVGAGWIWVALPLAASFPLHVLDLRERLQSREE